MADRDSADAEGEDTDASETDESGFVFGERRAEGTSGTAEHGEATHDTSGRTTDTLTMAIVGIGAALIVLAAGAQLFTSGGLMAVLGQDDPGQPGATTGATPTHTAATPTPAGTDTTASARDTDTAATTAGGGSSNSGAGDTDGSLKGGGGTATSAGGESSGGEGSTRGTKTGDTKTGGTNGGGNTGTNGDSDDGGFVQSPESNNRPPVIKSTSLVDKSHSSDHGGVLVFEVGWTVTDPDDNLREVRVTLLEHPNGNDTTTLVRRPMPVGGGRNKSTTTFRVPLHDSLGDTYAVRFAAEDQFGNSVNMSRREVANGKDD